MQRPLGGQGLDRRRAQRGHPVEPSRFEVLSDARLSDHPAVADQDHPVELETLFELANLRRQRAGITDITVKHLDRHGAALGGTQQPVDDLPLARFAVSAIAILCQWATAALEIAGGQIVEHQAAALEMTPGEGALDLGLRRQQEIEREIEFVLVDLAELEDGSQRMRRRRHRAELARGDQFGGRLDHAGNDHRQCQLREPAWPARQQVVKTELARHAEHRGDMTVWQRALDLKAIRGSRHGLVFQNPGQRLDLGLGPARQVGQRTGLDPVADAIALA